MAYVGTPSMRGNSTSTLASIIQGEAGGEGITGMRAVAGVIGNRASQNFSGYGTTPISQALARNQFQGQSGSYSPQAYQVAQELESGTLRDPTGGATSYANPGASSARWARKLDTSNSVKIGNHYFTDNQKGVPFSGNGTQASNGLNTSSDGTVQAAGGTYQNFDANGKPTTNDSNVTSSEFPEIGSEGGSNSAVKNGGSSSATGSQSGTPQQGNGGTQTTPGSGSGGSGFGFYMNEVARAIASALAPATKDAGQAVAKATDNVAGATKESGTTIAKGSTDAAGITSAQSKANATLAADSAKDYFGRIVIILLGIIFVAGGVSMFVFNKNPIKIAKDLVT